MYKSRFIVETEGREVFYTDWELKDSPTDIPKTRQLLVGTDTGSLSLETYNVDSKIREVLFLNKYQLDRTIFTLEEYQIKEENS